MIVLKRHISNPLSEFFFLKRKYFILDKLLFSCSFFDKVTYVFSVSHSLLQRSLQNLNRLDLSIIGQGFGNINFICVFVQILNVDDKFIFWIWNDFDFSIIEKGVNLKCKYSSLNGYQLFEFYLSSAVWFPGKPFKN